MHLISQAVAFTWEMFETMAIREFLLQYIDWQTATYPLTINEARVHDGTGRQCLLLFANRSEETLRDLDFSIAHA
jgi:hypothetical protein